jgi:hypothetical protein
MISAAEISIDVHSHLLDDYLDIQHLLPRRLLGTNSPSMLAVLFTETGLMFIRIRRLLAFDTWLGFRMIAGCTGHSSTPWICLQLENHAGLAAFYCVLFAPPFA